MSGAESAAPPPAAPAPRGAGGARRGGAAAALVGAGILASRLFGLVRERVFAYYLGNSASADAFRAAFRIPNILQNLFGEGALSASFIPVYASRLARGDEAEARRLAGAVLTLLALVTAVLVAAGVVLAPRLGLLVPAGFAPGTRALTVQLIQILFPGAGLFVLSAWCLGVLNSHRRFFLSYAAPVAWNVAMIAALVGFGPRRTQPELVRVLAVGSVVGALLVLLVQLPAVLRLVGAVRLRLDAADGDVRAVVRNFVPAFVSRGVVQISSYVDLQIAGLIAAGAVSAISYAQVIYTLPVSLFGIGIAAAELPELAADAGGSEAAAALRGRLDAALRRVAFFIVPSAAAFVAVGDAIASLLFQSGAFGARDVVWVWQILAGSAAGLLAGTLARLYASTFYALRDTRTPLRFALLRVALTIGLGLLAGVYLPRALGVDRRWGAAALTFASGLAGWVEFGLLRRALGRRIGATGLPVAYSARLWTAAAAAAAAAWAVKLAWPAGGSSVARSAAMLVAFALAYGAAAGVAGVPIAVDVWARVRRATPGRGR